MRGEKGTMMMMIYILVCKRRNKAGCLFVCTSSVSRMSKMLPVGKYFRVDRVLSMFSLGFLNFIYIIYYYIYFNVTFSKKPLRVAGMSADYVRGWEIVWKMNIWPRSEASMANMKFWRQSLSQVHYQPTYQQARKGFIYFISLPLISVSCLNRSPKS